MARKPRVTNIDPDDETPIAETDDDRLVRQAKKRFKLCADWYSVARSRQLDDIKFANADAYNMFQWPNNVQSARGYGTGMDNERPCLTINKTQQHNYQIVNDGRQNKTSIKCRPVGDGATYEAAQIYEGLFRHIEYISNAQAAYTRAQVCQVEGGIGYCRLNTDYVDQTTFDQDVYIQSIEDPLSVFIDPDYAMPDGSDMRYAFVFVDMPRDQFKTEYPDVPLPPKSTWTSTLGNDENAWVAEQKVRVAEYYYRTEKRDELIVFLDPQTGDKMPIKRSELDGMSGELRDAFNEQLKDPYTKKRDLIGHEVRWIKIAGETIVDRKEWPGETVPLYFSIGKKTVIDGELDIKGHTRALLDSQRMLNYNASAAIEYGALQGKTPYLAPSQAIEELEQYWGRENLDNLAVLPWNHVDDDGKPIPPPIRIQPPSAAPVYQQGRENAEHDMMLVSGQYQPMMGEPSNERSGKAIQARQRQGENATYHFIDNHAMMIRRIGKEIVPLIPKLYDTPRVMKIMGENGEETEVTIDPNAKKAFEETKARTNDAIREVLFNPSVGRYDVMSDVGPDYATRRQEAANALTQIAQQNPELMGSIGDLIFLALDFPLADEAAERLRRGIPAHLLGDGPAPEVLQLQSQMTALQKLNDAISAKVIQLQSKATTNQEQKSVNEFKAATDRMKVVFDHFGIPASMQVQMLHDLAKQEHQGSLDVASQVTSAILSSSQDDTGAAEAA